MSKPDPLLAFAPSEGSIDIRRAGLRVAPVLEEKDKSKSNLRGPTEVECQSNGGYESTTSRLLRRIVLPAILVNECTFGGLNR